MNHIYRLVWNNSKQAYVAVNETACGRGKASGTVGGAVAALLLAAVPHLSTMAQTLPTGGQVSAGAASISRSANTLTVQQASQKAAINWQSFSVGSGATVNFVQPNASSVILNRVVGNESSVIAGALNANGQVFLLNSNGVLFTGTSSVNVGGLVASTLNLSDADFMAGRSTFSANGSKASVINLGTINAADGGYVALLGNQVKNEGVITAKLGTAIMAAGDQISLNFNGDSLVGVTIDQGTLDALVENKRAIRADGGLVVLTAKGLDAVMATVVNNTGEVRAQTVANKEGKIYLLGGMDNNRIEVGGTLDASAPNGGNGGFIETSAAKVKFANDVAITTKASSGKAGTWLIDPLDFTVAASGGDITGAALGTLLGSNSIQIETAATSPTASATNLVGTSGTNGDINVNDAVSWSANNTLTLNAYRNININADITASGATGKLALQYGQGAVAAADYNIAKNIHINLQDGANFSTKLGSNGTVENYTVISSATDLQNINNALSGNFALGANVNLSGIANFAPIGNWDLAPDYSPFDGKFTGLGHTVSNLTVSATANPDIYSAGLFSVIYGAEVRDVRIDAANVTNNRDSVSVGALAGYAKDSIIKNVDVTNSTISANPASFTVNNRPTAGGIVGYMRDATAVSNSSSSAVVSSTGLAGGITGTMQGFGGSISNTYFSGSVRANIWAGGIAGEYIAVSDASVINNVYVTGSVTGIGSTSYAGGIAGRYGDGSLLPTISNAHVSGPITAPTSANADPIAADRDVSGGTSGTKGTMSNVYWDMTTTGLNTTGLATGFSTAFTGNAPTGISNANAYTQASYAGFDFTNTGAWFSVDGSTRPFLRMEATNNISNAHQLQLMSMNLANNYTLANNIDLAPSLTNKSEMWKDNSASVNYSSYVGSFVPVGATNTNSFTGTFDGLTHTVDHLTIYLPTTDNVGLFGMASDYAAISNVSLTNAAITGQKNVGALVGYMSGSSVSHSSSSGAVDSSFSGESNTGGLIGNVELLSGDNSSIVISDVHSSATVTSAGSEVGGLIGLASNQVSPTRTLDIVRARAYGDVTSTNTVLSDAGGLIGNTNTMSLTDGYASGVVRGSGDNVGGLIGQAGFKTTLLRATAANPTTIGVVGTTNVGGLVGYSYSSTLISDSHASGAVTGTGDAIGGLIGRNEGVPISWGDSGNITNSYATGNVTATGTGQNVGGFIGYLVTEHYTNPSVLATTSISNSYATGNVSATGTAPQSVGGFIGYAYAKSGAVNITNSYASGHVTAGASTFAGGFIGLAEGATIENSYATGNVSGPLNTGGFVGGNSYSTIRKSYATGNVSGSSSVGGFVGTIESNKSSSNLIQGLIEDSYYVGTVTADDPSGFSNVGGFAGYNLGSVIKNSFAVATINLAPSNPGVAVDGVGGFVGQLRTGRSGDTGVVENSYAVSTFILNGITPTLFGGFSGNHDVWDGVVEVTNSFWNTQVSGLATSAGGVGKTTAEMKTLATFSGTAPAWSVVTDASLSSVYPQLRWATTGLSAGSSVWVMAAPSSSPIYLRLTGGYSLYGSTPTFGYAYYTTASGSTEVTNASPTGSVIWSGAPTATSAVGTYSLTYGSGISLGNSAYTLSAGSAVNWSVNPAPLTITASNVSKVYGQVPSLSNFTSVGLQNSETIGSATLNSSGRAVTAGVTGSPYAIVPSSATGGTFNAANYDITYVDGALTVTPLAVHIAAVNGAAREYDGTSNAPANLLYVANAINGDAVTLSGNATLVSGTAGVEALADIAALTLSNPNYTVVGGSAAGSVVVALPQSVVASAANLLTNGNGLNSPSQSLPAQGNSTAVSADRLAERAINVVNPLPQISAAFGPDAALTVISSPNADEPSQVVSLSQVRSMLKAATQGAAAEGTRDVRVPVSRNSLADIVNGGVRLPLGVEQQLFVVQAN